MSAFRTELMSENYGAVQNGISNICANWIKNRGGEHDELIQETFLYFHNAFNRFDGRGDWKKYVFWFVKKQLLEYAEKLARDSKRRQDNSSLMDYPDHRQPTERLNDLFEEMSIDGVVIASLALSPPEVLEVELKKKPSTGRAVRSCIRQYLKDLGWSASRVTDAYTELADLLRRI